MLAFFWVCVQLMVLKTQSIKITAWCCCYSSEVFAGKRGVVTFNCTSVTVSQLALLGSCGGSAGKLSQLSKDPLQPSPLPACLSPDERSGPVGCQLVKICFFLLPPKLAHKALTVQTGVKFQCIEMAGSS